MATPELLSQQPLPPQPYKGQTPPPPQAAITMEQKEQKDIAKIPDEKNTTTINGYEIYEVLGKGSFGQVFKAKKDGTIFALKLLDLNMIKQRKIEKFVSNEINLMRRLNHRNVVKIYDVFQTTSVIFLVLEYCNQGTLLSHVSKNRPNPQQCLDHFIQILAGVKHIHECNILHRDLKPENIFLHDGVLKIADFGLAQFENDDFVYCGTSFYMAPEILQREAVSYKSDLWSLGITMFYMLFRRLPFYSSSTLLQIIRRWTDPAFEISTFLTSKDQTLDADFEDFFRKVLVFDHNARVSFKDLYNLPLIQNKISSNEYKESYIFYSNLDNNLNDLLHVRDEKQSQPHSNQSQPQIFKNSLQHIDNEHANNTLPPPRFNSSFLNNQYLTSSIAHESLPPTLNQWLESHRQIIQLHPPHQPQSQYVPIPKFPSSFIEDVPEDDSPNISDIYPSNNITYFDKRRDITTNIVAHPLQIIVNDVSQISASRLKTQSLDVQAIDFLTPNRFSSLDVEQQISPSDVESQQPNSNPALNKDLPIQTPPYHQSPRHSVSQPQKDSSQSNQEIQYISSHLKSSIFITDSESKDFFNEMESVKQQIYKYQLLEECLNGLQNLRLPYSGKCLLCFIVSKMIVFISHHVCTVLECASTQKVSVRMAGFLKTKKALKLLAFVQNDLKMWENKMLVYMNGVDTELDLKEDQELLREITPILQGFLKELILPFTRVIDKLFIGTFALATTTTSKEESVRYKKFCLYLLVVLNIQQLFNGFSEEERILLKGFTGIIKPDYTPKHIGNFIETIANNETIDAILITFIQECVFPINSIRQIEFVASSQPTQMRLSSTSQ